MVSNALSAEAFDSDKEENDQPSVKPESRSPASEALDPSNVEANGINLVKDMIRRMLGMSALHIIT
jgi:hypothetical protein